MRELFSQISVTGWCCRVNMAQKLYLIPDAKAILFSGSDAEAGIFPLESLVDKAVCKPHSFHPLLEQILSPHTHTCPPWALIPYLEEKQTQNRMIL